MGVMSTVLHGHFKQQDETRDPTLTNVNHLKVDQVVTLGVPFTFKVIPEVASYEYGNEFICQQAYLTLKEKFADAVKAAQSTKNNDVKYHPAAWYFLIKAYVLFNSISFNEYFAKAFGAKHTMLYSNVTGFCRTVKYFGGKAKRMFYVGSGIGNICTGAYMVSIDKRT